MAVSHVRGHGGDEREEEKRHKGGWLNIHGVLRAWVDVFVFLRTKERL